MKGGDGVADFERMFQEHSSLIFRYLMKLCGDVSLAEELTQETFFRAYMNLSALRDEKKVAAWLCRIAKNCYFAWCREQKKQLPLNRQTEDLTTPDVAELFEEKELAARAFSCLHILEDPYREVFTLAVFGGLTLKAISAMYGKSESWARVTYYRAKQKIMEGLGK